MKKLSRYGIEVEEESIRDLIRFCAKVYLIGNTIIVYLNPILIIAMVLDFDIAHKLHRIVRSLKEKKDDGGTK